ncbi:hypothetical protein [Pinirhizobacter sp.]|jgi:hypothetical protein|uniref:hypothetical protein n=1 Tax=Pinirhizobacter sp. TaxID=2950432 RepID=UPI002F42D009
MSIDAQAGNDILERVLEAEGPLVWLDVDDVEGLVARFAAMARRSGQSMYRWRPEDGLASLREASTRVPGCPRVGDVLRYILQSLHFGIYLVTPPALVGAQDAHLLRQVARLPAQPVRRVILLGGAPSLAESLDDVLVQMTARERAAGLRLRDGRWVT